MDGQWAKEEGAQWDGDFSSKRIKAITTVNDNATVQFWDAPADETYPPLN